MKKIIKILRKFTADRDWNQYHSPKNLAIALFVECAEVTEIFQLLTQDQSRATINKVKVQEELADVFIYTLLLADKFDIDLIKATHKKIKINETKYPIKESKSTTSPNYPKI